MITKCRWSNSEASLGPPRFRAGVGAVVRAVGGVRGCPHGLAAAPRWAHAGGMVAQIVTVNDVLDGHVTLDIECLDRIYLNAYAPVLQTSAQVVAFLSGHLGFPFPSPVLFRQLGDRFRRAVLSFADANGIPWVKFGKDEAKLEVMQPYLARQAGTGRSGVAAIGVAKEFQRVWTAYEGKTSAGTPRWSFVKTDRRVTCYYFYLWDEDFGPAFIKVCAYFPYPAPINTTHLGRVAVTNVCSQYD
jgi:hypothetical protein